VLPFQAPEEKLLTALLSWDSHSQTRKAMCKKKKKKRKKEKRKERKKEKEKEKKGTQKAGKMAPVRSTDCSFRWGLSPSAYMAAHRCLFQRL